MLTNLYCVINKLIVSCVQGGFKLELLDPQERHLMDLTPTNNQSG